MAFHYLTKSRYKNGAQCGKLLWLNINGPGYGGSATVPAEQGFEHIKQEALTIELEQGKEKSPEEEKAIKLSDDTSNKITEYSHLYFGQGVVIEEENQHISKAANSTKENIKKGEERIFNAVAKYNKISCRVDILKKIPGQENFYDIYTIKWSTKTKRRHIPEVAFQRYCFESAGYNIVENYLMHINSLYTRQGDIDPQQLFAIDNITDAVLQQIESTKNNIEKFIEIMEGSHCPEIKTGNQCGSYKNFKCAFFSYCHTPVKYYNINELKNEYIKKLEKMNIKYLKDIPDDFKLERRYHQAVISNKTKKPVIDKEDLKNYLDKLVYPLYYLDFETLFNMPIPPFNNTRPYNNIPFQFSLHIQQKKNGPLEHHEFLLKEAKDGREELVKKMLSLLGKNGSIIAHNISFEQGRIKDLAAWFPQYSSELLALLSRFWDTIVPFRKGYYAHYDFHCSASLKSILPVLVPSLSYNKLNIQEGKTAALKYELWIKGYMDEKEWEKTYNDLLEYCKLDTLAMSEILRVFYEAVETI